MEKKVAIVGAGISGLLACKYMLSKGFRPIVFEASNGVGGVWTKTVETTKIQTPKSYYQFSDFPWSSSVTEDHPNQNQYEGPSEEEMQSWSLWGATGEPFKSDGKWKVTVENKQSLSTEVHLVDFVILCVGRFSDVPNIPEFPPNKGPEAFQGKVIHSMEYSDMDYESAAKFVTGKQVTVVGFQKFAMDIAMECSSANGVENPCTVLYKTEHWNVPDYHPWGVPLPYLYLNRFSELLIHKPGGEGFLLSLLATLLTPLKWAFSKFVETQISKKLGLAKYGMVPKHSFLGEVSSCFIATVPEKFFDRVGEGSIILKKSPGSFGFCQEGILVGEEVTPLKTELVILATGFRGEQKLKDISVSPTFQDYIVGSQESRCYLAPLQMASRALCRHLQGTEQSIKEMEKDVMKWDKHAKQYAGKDYRRSCIGALQIWYNGLWDGTPKGRRV